MIDETMVLETASDMILMRILTLLPRFQGAYCTVWEKEPLLDLFGEMDVVDETLPGMAEKIIASTT